MPQHLVNVSKDHSKPRATPRPPRTRGLTDKICMYDMRTVRTPFILTHYRLRCLDNTKKLSPLSMPELTSVTNAKWIIILKAKVSNDCCSNMVTSFQYAAMYSRLVNIIMAVNCRTFEGIQCGSRAGWGRQPADTSQQLSPCTNIYGCNRYGILVADVGWVPAAICKWP